MKTILRSTLAIALLASWATALAGEDPPDQGTTGLQPPSAETAEGARAEPTGAISHDAAAEGARMAAAQDEEPSRPSAFDPFERSMDAGG